MPNSGSQRVLSTMEVVERWPYGGHKSCSHVDNPTMDTSVVLSLSLIHFQEDRGTSTERESHKEYNKHYFIFFFWNYWSHCKNGGAKMKLMIFSSSLMLMGQRKLCISSKGIQIPVGKQPGKDSKSKTERNTETGEQRRKSRERGGSSSGSSQIRQIRVRDARIP